MEMAGCLLFWLNYKKPLPFTWQASHWKGPIRALPSQTPPHSHQFLYSFHFLLLSLHHSAPTTWTSLLFCEDAGCPPASGPLCRPESSLSEIFTIFFFTTFAGHLILNIAHAIPSLPSSQLYFSPLHVSPSNLHCILILYFFVFPPPVTKMKAIWGQVHSRNHEIFIKRLSWRRKTWKLLLALEIVVRVFNKTETS